MNLERDRFLTEAMGLCWHEFTYSPPLHYPSIIYPCIKCGVPPLDNSNISFSSWYGFGKLWEWSIKQEWRGKFIRNKLETIVYVDNGARCNDYAEFNISMISPDKFADAVYEFLNKEE